MTSTSLTVRHMKANNEHVKDTPAFMLKHDDTPISDTELKAHAVAHGAFYLAWPTSSIPSLIKDPQIYGISAAVGFAAGGLYRVVTDISWPPSVSFVKNLKDRLVHSAALNNTAKAVIALAHSSGITANTLAGIYVDSEYIRVAEGLFAGAMAGYQGAGYVLHVIHPVQDQPDTPASTNSTSTESTRLLTASSDPVA